jgi:uncharacterized protein (TIGR00730 family)
VARGGADWRFACCVPARRTCPQTDDNSPRGTTKRKGVVRGQKGSIASGPPTIQPLDQARYSVQMNKIRAVCVYCGSSPGNDAAYVEAGERLGSALAAAGVRLIYGGGTTGVMGAVAHGALSAGGEIGAIIPRFLINRETTKAALTQFNDVTITETMHERKHKMFERSDAFVALPGGIGTVEEIVEIMTWGQLGQHRKPVVFANINGFWDPMLGMLDHLRRAGFIHSGHLMQPIVVDRVEAIIPAIVAAAEEIDTYGNESPSVIDKM